MSARFPGFPPRVSSCSSILSRFLPSLVLLACAAVPASLFAQATAPALAVGSVNVGSSTTATVSFTFTASTTVTAVSVLSQGVTNGDFQRNTSAPGNCAAATYQANSGCTVGVTFTAGAPGLRYGAVTLATSSGSQAGGIAYISGIGQGAIPALSPGTLTAITGTASFGNAFGLASDAAGNVYVTDHTGGAVYKEAISGTVATQTTIATGISNVGGVAVDGAGNVYIADGNNKRIVLETYSAGAYTAPTVYSCSNACSAIQVDAAGNLFIGNASTVIEDVLSTVTPGLRTPTQIASGFNSLTSIAVDPVGNLYLSDQGTSSAYLLTYNSGNGTYATSTIASGVSNLDGISLDPAGNIYVGTNVSGAVYRYTAAGGGTYTHTTLASVGGYANGVTVAPHGVVYTNNGASTLYKLDQTVSASSTSSSLNYSSPDTAMPLSNIGNSSFLVTGSSTAAPFAFASSNACTSRTVVPSATSCSITYNFSPTATGTQTGTLQVTTTAGSGTVNLTGNVSGTATKVAFYTAPASPIVAGGNPGTIQAILEDANSSYVTTPGVSVSLSSNYAGTTTYPAATTASNGGLATFNTSAPALTVAGTYIYTAASTGLTSVTANEVVAAGPTAQLKATAATTAYVGYPLTVTVQALDQYGNQSTSTDTVSLATTPSTSTLPANFALANGTGSGSVTFNATGTYTVTAQDVTNPAPAVTSSTTATITVLNVPSYTVTTATDDASGVPANCPDQANGGGASSTCSLRDAFAAVTALNNANTASFVPTINFSPSLYGQTLIMLAAQSVNGNVSLVGPGAGANAITLSGNNAVTFLNNTAASAVTNFSGLTFANFTGTQSTVLIANGAMTFINDNFTGNNYTTTTNNGGVMGINGAIAFTGCTFTGNTVALSGGAVASTPTTMTISNSLFSGNTARSNGGAVAIYGTGAVSITNTAFINNNASGYGGAIYVNSTASLTLASATFNGNTANPTGGAIYTIGLFTISNSTFTGNSASGAINVQAGAIYGISNGANSIRNTNFIGNFASTPASTAYGGALYVDHVALTNVLFSGNYLKSGSASSGGAAYMTGAFTNTWTDVTLTGNCTAPPSNATPAVPCAGTGATTQLGGAVYQTGNSVNNLYNVTVTANSAKTGGGWYKVTGSLNAYNSVISGNTASGTYADISTTVNTNSSSYLNIGSTAACVTSATNGCTPMLSALGSYGGSALGSVGAVVGGTDYTTPVQTLLPLPGSPLLRTGNPSNLNSATTDARGLPRTFTVSGTKYVDIGATEADYSLAFLAQPANALVGQPITGTTSVGTASAAPSVQLYESNQPFAAPGATSSIAAAAGTLAGTTTQTFNATGVAVFSGLSITPAETNDTLLSTICAGKCATTPQNLVVTSNPFNVHGPIAYTMPPPANLAVGQTVPAIVVKETGNGGAAYVSGDTVTLTVTGPNSYSQTYTATSANGSFSFNVAPLPAAGPYAFTASDATFTTQTAVATTTAGTQVLGSLQVTGFPTPDHNGTAHSVTVTAYDTTGAVFTGYAGTVTITANDPLATLPANYTFMASDNGVHTFAVTLATGGTRTITATDTSAGVSGSETGIVVDDFIWVLSNAGTTNKLDETGALIATGGTAGSTALRGGIAIDASGNAWSVLASTNALSMTPKSGTAPTVFSGTGGLNMPLAVAIDGAGAVWVANNGNSTISAFTNAGVAKSGTSGYASSVLSGPSAIAIDATGGVWTTNKTGNTVVHTFGAAIPVVTPQATAVTNGTVAVTP